MLLAAAVPVLALLVAAAPAAAPGPRARLEAARALESQGRSAEALAEYLWCLDHGASDDASFFGLRMTDVLDGLTRLAATYPPANEALRARRERAARALAAGKAGWMEATDLVALDQRLGQPGASLAVYDAARARGASEAADTLFNLLVPVLVESRRYDDVVRDLGTPPVAPLQERAFGLLQTRVLVAAGSEEDDAGRAARLAAPVVAFGADVYEALVGARRHADALEAAAYVLAVDPSDETRRLLAARAVRAGHPEAAEILTATD